MIVTNIDKEDLVHQTPAGLLKNRAIDALTVYKTELNDLGVDLLNIFSPYKMMFFSFGVYSKVERAQRDFYNRIEAEGLSCIKKLCNTERIGKTSVSIYEFFSPIVRGKGVDYFPYSMDEDDGSSQLLAQRHFSIMVPSSVFQTTVDYFKRQLDEINEDCFVNADEDEVIVMDENCRDLEGYSLFCTHPSLMNPLEKKETAEILGEKGAITKIDERLRRLLGCRGGINIIANPFHTKSIEDLSIKICEQRFRLCKEIYSLIRYEKIEGELVDLSKEDKYLGKLYSDMWNKIQGDYPVIRIEAL